MALGAIASFLAPIAVQGAGALISRWAGGKQPSAGEIPEAPDIVSPVRGRLGIARQRLANRIDRNVGQLDSSLAARGAVGSAGVADREALFRTNSQAAAEMEARAADILADTINRQRLLEYDRAMNVYNRRSELAGNRARGIGGFAQGISDLLVAQGAFGGGGGGGSASGGGGGGFVAPRPNMPEITDSVIGPATIDFDRLSRF